MASVSYNVSLVGQAATRTCWYACAQMLLAWRDRRAYPGQLVLDNASDEAVHKLNTPLGLGSYRPFFVDTLHMCLEHVPLGRENAFQWLTIHGPLIYSGRYSGYRNLFGWGSHAVVITGVEIDDSAASVRINDPWPWKIGCRLVMSLDELIRTLPFSGPVVHC